MSSFPDISRYFSASPQPRLNIYLAAAAGLSLGVLLNKSLSSLYSPTHPDVLPSPRKSLLPTLSRTEIAELPYPPDVFPGARDVDSPYGTIRVYEWGPEDGRKVLFIHGISTPCIAFAGMAEKLVEKGCRVMLFDLFGRGYSDTPTSLPHDARLYTTQILLALSSSPLSWTGSNQTFSLVGYSLGGCIAAAFTSYFPSLIDSLILIAPAGLVRPAHIGWKSRVLYSTGWLPERLLQWLVRRRLEGGPSGAVAVTPRPQDLSDDVAADADNAVAAEVGTIASSAPQSNSNAPGTSFDAAPLFPHRPHISPAAAVRWQLLSHLGFLPAFMSSIRYAPIHSQHDRWTLIGRRLSARKSSGASASSSSSSSSENRQQQGKVLIILGRTDPIIVETEIAPDAREVLGRENVEVVVLEAGHEVPISKGGEIVDAVWKFWGEGEAGVSKGEVAAAT
ncbi:alpha/beta-hydrolase [Cryomyces antarcticus]